MEAIKPIVEVKNVTKKIGKKTIIDQMNLDIYPGEVFGLLGPNGAGKTTTIRMMVGLVRMTEGKILIKGMDIQKQFEKAIRYVGGIVKNPEMYRHMSGYKNLIHYARMVPGVTQTRIDECIRLVGLEERIKDKVSTYSLGMRQRLGVAQALLHSPSVLILDEPTNGLDPAGIREIRNYLRKLAAEEQMAVIVSSHLLSEMELMCDRIGIMKQGKVLGVQRVQDFVSKDAESIVRFEVGQTELAINALKGLASAADYHVADHLIQIQIAKEDVPALTRHLVQSGVDVYSIERVQTTLEDKFLEVTGGESIA